MYQTIADLMAAIRAGQIDPTKLQAFVDKNELYIYGPNSEAMFSDVVTPQDVALALGIEDVNQV